MGPHTKLVPALKAFPNDILVTADDDVFYPVNWFEQLRSAYLNDPGKIYTHRAHEIGLDENNNITPYNDWHFSVKKTDKPELLFPTGVGGVLYPPHSLYHCCVYTTLFTQLTPACRRYLVPAMAKRK